MDSFIEQIRQTSGLQDFIDTVLRRTFNFRWILSYEYLIAIKKELDIKLKTYDVLSENEIQTVTDFVKILQRFACHYTAQDCGAETARGRLLKELFYIKNMHTYDFEYDPNQKCLVFTGKPIPPVRRTWVTRYVYYWPLPD